MRRLLPLVLLALASCHTAPPMHPALLALEDRLDRPQLRHWKHIVLHHSASAHGSALEFHRFHKNERGWDGLAYHFVIGNGNGSGDGEIEVGYRWTDQIHGAHAGNPEYNQYGIGICLVGNFEETGPQGGPACPQAGSACPTPAQRESLRALLRWLMERCEIPSTEIVRHKDVRDRQGLLAGGTECPGKNFPFEEIVREVSR